MLNIRNRTFKVKYFGKNIIYPQKGEIYDAIIPIMKKDILLDRISIINNTGWYETNKEYFEILDFEEYNKIIFDINEDIEKLKNIRKVKCISLEYNNTIYAGNNDIQIKKGGVYDVLEFLPSVAPKGRFRLSIDNRIYPIQLFTPISDWRKEQLNKILK